MKTHEIAKLLRSLAELLENGPNTAIEKARMGAQESTELNTGQIAVNLNTLADLSRLDKQQWLGFVKELGYPIEIRPRDASRDILGKLLNHLEGSESAREKLTDKAASKGSDASPELMRALSSLLKGV